MYPIKLGSVCYSNMIMATHTHTHVHTLQNSHLPYSLNSIKHFPAAKWPWTTEAWTTEGSSTVWTWKEIAATRQLLLQSSQMSFSGSWAHACQKPLHYAHMSSTGTVHRTNMHQSEKKKFHIVMYTILQYSTQDDQGEVLLRKYGGAFQRFWVCITQHTKIYKPSLPVSPIALTQILSYTTQSFTPFHLWIILASNMELRMTWLCGYHKQNKHFNSHTTLLSITTRWCTICSTTISTFFFLLLPVPGTYHATKHIRCKKKKINTQYILAHQI